MESLIEPKKDTNQLKELPSPFLFLSDIWKKGFLQNFDWNVYSYLSPYKIGPYVWKLLKALYLRGSFSHML